MARVYDVVEKIKNGNQKPTIKIDENTEFTVNTSKNTAILIKAISEDNKVDDIERLDQIIEAGLGKDALSYINNLDLSMDSYSVIINAIMAAISNMSIDEMEELSKKEKNNFRKRK